MLEFLKAVKDLLTKRNEFANIWGGAFNGQSKRRELFKEILRLCKPSCIVETGTYKGNTTSYMFQHSGLPIYTVENHLRSYYYSKLRFFFNRKVKVYFDDSRNFIQNLPEKVKKDEIIFFYLDAHWDNDLPLKKEVDLIFNLYPKSIIMIDDFKVPNDAGYKFDTYGETELSIEYLLDDHNQNRIRSFFPVSSEFENGSKRGCCIITENPELFENLKNTEQLTVWNHSNEV